MNILEIINKLNINLTDKIYFSDLDEDMEELYIDQGYKNYIYYIDINDKELRLLQELERFNLTFKVKPFGSTNNDLLSKQLSIGKMFLTEHFKMHDILYLKKYKLKKGSPFSIPVETIDEELVCGYLLKQDIQKNDSELETIFRKIILSNKISPYTSILYSHEITHSQLGSIKGSIENAYNNEVLSIFMELLYGYYCGKALLKNAIIISRANDILEYYKVIVKYNDNNMIIDEELYNNIIFYISIITATKLFIVYKNSSANIQKELLNNIQKVFDEKRTLEETLKIYELDWTKSK